MWGSISLKELGKGVYNPLPEQSDGRDGENSSLSLDNRDPRPYFLGLKLMLAAFGGFIFAIMLVNLFPGEMVRSGETKLQKLVHVPSETVVFQHIPMFEEAPTEDSDMAWEALLGPSLGLVALNQSKKYGLPPGDPKGPNTHVYQLSVAHQIQCLYLIRKVYWGESKGIFDISAQPPSPLITHTNHCFDYLLQSLKCSADMSLEWRTDEIGNFVGWDVAHTCKSWEGVLGFMMKYKYDEAEKAIDYHSHDND